MDTIAAIATAAGSGGIGIVRVSGAFSREILDRFFRSGNEIRDRLACFGKIVDESGSVLDSGIVLFFQAPRSYTGEDMVEFQIHGAPVILKRLLEAILQTGLVRLAEPGEFTRRAFQNGKIDLAETERLNFLLKAETELQLRVVRELEGGKFLRGFQRIRKQLLRLSSQLEAAIEYPEEDETADTLTGVTEHVARLLVRLQNLSSSYDRVIPWAQGVRVVITGAPNSGKSSLLNAIAGYQRAIVTSIPGTTRDTLELTLDIDGLKCTFIDTAGIRAPGDEVEEAGISRALLELSRADLIVFLKGGEPTGTLDPAIRNLENRITILSVQGKADLSNSVPEGELSVSSKTGEGVPELLKRIRKEFDNVDLSEHFLFTERQKLAVDNAISELKKVLVFVRDDRTIDLAAAHLENTRWFLETIIGIVTTDEILDGIFSNYCLGK